MIKQYVLVCCSGILPRSTPFIITSRENEYSILSGGNQVVSSCNHEDTRLVLYDSNLDSAVVCQDAVVYILMIWAYFKLNITNNWYLKHDHEKFAQIRKNISYLDKTLSVKTYQKYRPQLDAIPNLAFYWVLKITKKVLKKLLCGQD